MARSQEDRQVLQTGTADVAKHVAWIAQEFRMGFEAVDRIDRPAVTIFGSARIGQDHPDYAGAMATAAGFAGEGFAVVSGSRTAS